jgi:2',3'-cyclic-nucleotide 2'-phosphodiesterase/3'-nucleotidase
VKKALAELRSKHSPDVVIAAIHAGLGRDLGTGAPAEPAENVVYSVATEVPGLDAIVFGHSHQQLKDTRIGNVLVIQPKNYAASVARIDFTLAREGDRWKVSKKEGRLLPVTEATAAAPDILEVAAPYHEAAEKYLSMPVAKAPRDLDARLGRVDDNPLVDAVQKVQLHYTKADVSFTALFNPRLKVPAGPVTVRQIAALYPYDNELYLIEGNGKMVKDALENAARYYLSCRDARCEQGPLVNTKVMGFNYDVAEGVEYEIDLTRPEGDRVRNLRWKGKPLAPDQPLKVAVNNYRAAGSAGYGMFKGAKILWHSQEEIREMIVRYYGEVGVLPGQATGNWKVVPEAARRTLSREAVEN